MGLDLPPLPPPPPDSITLSLLPQGPEVPPEASPASRGGAEPEVGTPQLLVDWFAVGLYGFMTKRCSEDWLAWAWGLSMEWGPGTLSAPSLTMYQPQDNKDGKLLVGKQPEDGETLEGWIK